MPAGKRIQVDATDAALHRPGERLERLKAAVEPGVGFDQRIGAPPAEHHDNRLGSIAVVMLLPADNIMFRTADAARLAQADVPVEGQGLG